MRRKVFGKKGSYTVFLAMFMSGMMIMSGAVISAAHQMAVDSSCEDLGRVWAGSILGEYDRELRDRYGFYGYIGNEDLTREKLVRYADWSFKKKKYIKMTSLDCHLKEYKLTDLDTFRQQMMKITASLWRPVPFDSESGISGSDKTDGVSEGSGNKSVSAHRYISAGWIIGGLPSRNCSGQSLKGSGGSSLMETAYIFKSFKDHVDERELGKTYFRNEIEYIITGKLDEERSRKLVYAEIFTERNALNLAYLYSCTAKRQAALEAAEIITPGPEAVLTQAIILEIWALLESKNDLALLYDGKQVPIMKKDDNWALELKKAVDVVEEDKDTEELDTGESKKYVKPKRIEGQKYADYLKTLLIAVPEKKRLLRIMDLIQINMKYAYCDYFLMDDLYVGLDYTMVINGKEHTYHDEYQKKK